MTFADILPHLLAGHEVTLGDDPRLACHYQIRRGTVWTRYPFWEHWISRDYISLDAIMHTQWNYAPADSQPNTPPSAPAYADA